MSTKRVKLQVPDGERIPVVGEMYYGALVVASFPEVHSPDIVVETDDSAIVALHAVDSRPERTDYGPVAVADPPSALQVGNTYPPDAIRARGHFGAGQVLRIVDTGLDQHHVAFDTIQVDTDTGDSHGHGTHCASTAASSWGIASEARIIARAGIPGGNGTESSVANAIRAAVDADPQPGPLSLSLGGSSSSVIDAACQYARSKGMIVVVAAGNTAGAAIGSPARAADVIVLACDRNRNYANFTSGTGWTNPNRVTEYGVDIWAAQAGTRDVARAMSGTSMACPGVAGKLALLLASGHSREEALTYLWAHRSSPPAVGVSILTEDFGEDAMPTPDARIDALHGIMDEVRRLVREAQDMPPERVWGAMIHNVGPIYDYAGQVKSLFPKGDGGGGTDPPPPPTRRITELLVGFTAPTHWDGSPRKIDLYADANGRSHGMPLALPVGCIVKRRTIIGPLVAGAPCFDCSPELQGSWADGRVVLPAGDQMHTAIAYADNGKAYAFTHVDDIREGRHEAESPFAICGLSGLRNLPGNPSHHHIAVLSRHDPNWNGESGDLNALAEWQGLGFHPAIVQRIPGPQDYMSGQAEAGRFR